MRIPNMVRRAGAQNAGTAAIEFAIIAPVLMIALIGLVELGFSIQQAMQVQDAAEAGAVYAGRYGWDQAGIANAVVNATGADDITATPAPFQFCGCPGEAGIAAVDCDATCPDGSGPSHYAQINASMPHASILTGLGLPIPAVFTGHAVVRVE